MERHTYAVNFWIRPTKARKDGSVPIEVTITLNGERASFSTGKKIQVEDWDSNKQKIKGSNEQAKLLNNQILQIKNTIYKKEIELLDRGYIITAELLKDAFFNKIEAIQTKTLFQIWNEFLSSLQKMVGNGTSKATYYVYEHTERLLVEYIQEKYKRNDLHLLELNYSFMSDFDVFLRTVHKQRINTTTKHLKALKRVVNIALANKFIPIDPFMNYKVERENVDKVFLTEEEMRKIINKDFPILRLERVRDIFIFSCFTGLSYSDVKTLDESHFVYDDEGRVWIKKHRVKTGVLSRIPLLPIPKLILEKYKGGEKLLPVVDISSTDAYLKEIADLCGINKRISFHTARFTFATTVTLMDISVICTH